MPTGVLTKSATGRGAKSNHTGRFEASQVTATHDGWYEEPAPEKLATTVHAEAARSIISRNRSPDIPFEQSINPYRGCEHGCIYCYARPSHAWLNLSPGLDFETQLFYKRNAAQLLEATLRKAGYRCKAITLGANTDVYQPIERSLGITRSLLEVLQRFRHPLTVLSKSTLIERDLDLLAPMSAAGLASVMISVTSMDASLKRSLEPRAASPAARLRVIRTLTQAGVRVGVLVAPVIPLLTDHELEDILAAAADAGAVCAGYVLLRLPLEVAPLFQEWLAVHAPGKAEHVMSLLRQMHHGKEYDARFGQRQRGAGPFAALLQRRFRLACQRNGLRYGERAPLDCSQFQVPPRSGDQLGLPL